jgi:hypothetical protein
MRIKKIKNNQYIKSESSDYWIRNYTNSSYYLDINNKIPQSEYFLLMQNEFWNNKGRCPWIDFESPTYECVVIISDGYDLEKIYPLIEKISSKNVCFMGVNSILKKWKCKKSLNYYVVNNPYRECLSYLPHGKNLPRCIASNRTNYVFLQNYNGIKYRYSPVCEENFLFTKSNENLYQIDDYRNPVCASIGLAYKFKASRILLLCCDDVFEEKKPGSVPLEDDSGLYCYDQQNIAVDIIDAYLYWIKKKVLVKHYCRWKKIKNSEYIDLESIFDYITYGN